MAFETNLQHNPKVKMIGLIYTRFRVTVKSLLVTSKRSSLVNKGKSAQTVSSDKAMSYSCFCVITTFNQRESSSEAVSKGWTRVRCCE